MEIKMKTKVNLLWSGLYTITKFTKEYKRVVRKRIVVKEVNRKQVKLGVLLNDIGQFNKTGSLSYKWWIPSGY